MKLQEAIDRYGKIVDGKWAKMAEFCAFVVVPDELSKTWMKSDGPTKHIYCNIDMSNVLKRALTNVVSRGLCGQLKTFDGCLMIRDVRGEPGVPSTHSYALAIDINASTNKLGTEGDMSPELAACFTDEGFVHGRTFKRQDPMHFSLAWE